MMYVSDGIRKVTRGQRHDYLGKILDHSCPGVLHLDITQNNKTRVEEILFKVARSCEMVMEWPFVQHL
jgi:hypothetical protein